MKYRRTILSAIAGILAAALLCPDPAAASAGNVISAALGEVDYTESEDEYTKFGDWYGLPNAYWCDMFVSWCAMTAGVSSDRFPHHASCTAHVKLFREQGRYAHSAARGGSYIPLQGDVIFFYNNVDHPSGDVVSHTGLVLYAADGYVYTVEGNALANRLDWSSAEVWALQDGSLDPPDRVTVNRYPLDAPHIHGYGIPDYDDRTPLALKGFVDLGSHGDDAAVFQALSDMGVMPGTSLHTFSPNHGVTRGDFLLMAAALFGLPETGAAVMPFTDVSVDSPYYGAVRAACGAGLLSIPEDRLFRPDLYISPLEAQLILNRFLLHFGMPMEFFPFSEGDFSYLLNHYTIRADIARALYSLHWRMPLSEEYVGYLTIDRAEWTAPIRKLGGVSYLPVWFLQQAFPGLETPGGALPLPGHTAWDAGTARVLPAEVSLRYAGENHSVSGFIYGGISYIPVQTAAQFLPLELTGMGDLAERMFPLPDKAR